MHPKRPRAANAATPRKADLLLVEDEDGEVRVGMAEKIALLAPGLSADEQDAIRIGRDIVAQLNWRKLGKSKQVPVEDPLYDPDEILGLTSLPR